MHTQEMFRAVNYQIQSARLVKPYLSKERASGSNRIQYPEANAVNAENLSMASGTNESMVHPK